MQIRIKKLNGQASLPEYAHGPAEDAGLDVRSLEDALLVPGIPQAIPTGLALEIPSGYEVQLRPRSGLALKHAITLPNAPATIDPGYRGEVRVILLNLGHEAYQVKSRRPDCANGGCPLRGLCNGKRMNWRILCGASAGLDRRGAERC